MMRFLFQRESVPVLDAALSFAHQRHLTIMNNIANVDTPYYKRQALPEGEFHRTLNEAIEERREAHPTRFHMDDTRRIDTGPAGLTPVARRMFGDEAGPERHDENSIVIEKEMSDLAKNGLFIQTMQSLLKKKYDMYEASLRDRVV